MAITDALLLDPHPFEVFIAIRKETDRARGCGTISDPWDGSTAERFDQVLREHVQPGMRVNLGPGEFKTTGFSPGFPVLAGWQAKERVAIVGSGIESTKITLQLDTRHACRQVFAVGHELSVGMGMMAKANPVNFFELSDLTLDCAGDPSSIGSTCCGVRVMGDHVLIQRVRVQNWGAGSPVHPAYGIKVITGIPEMLGAEGFASHNAGVSHCVVVEPVLNPSSSDFRSTGIYVGCESEVRSVQASASLPEAYGVASYVRHCFIDGSISSALNLADDRAIAMNCCRGGVVEGNQIHRIRHGGPVVDAASVRDLIIRNNVFHDVGYGPEMKGNSPAFSSAALMLLERLSDEGGTIAQASTGGGPHYLSVGERVRITASAETSSEYKGTFEVSKIVDAGRFQYRMTAAPDQSSATSPRWQKVFGTRFALIEGNTIELATEGDGGVAVEISDGSTDGVATAPGPNGVHGDVVLRRNWIRYADLQSGLGYAGTAFKAAGIKNLTVSENVIECDPENPIQGFRCMHATYFNNKTSQGALIRGFSPNIPFHASELATDAEDVLMLGLL